jgi:hypothetical protein
MKLENVRQTVTGRIVSILALLSLLLAAFAFTPGTVLAQEQQQQEQQQQQQTGENIPRFWIVEVVQNESVTIETANLSANQTFNVLMGEMGRLGIGGTQVATTESGEGGMLRQTYNIPENLHGADRIAIRLESPRGFFAHNWFFNRNWAQGDPLGPGAVAPGTMVTDDQVTAQQPGDDPVGVGPQPGAQAAPAQAPRFWIVQVVQNESVTIETANLPANQTFNVRMGQMGTLGIGGAQVATTEAGEGGTLRQTYNIPENLHNADRIAIRLESPQGFFAHNWFFNRNWTQGDPLGPGAVAPGTMVTDDDQAAAQPGDPVGVGPGPADEDDAADANVPTLRIVEVVRDQSVTVETTNFPPNQTFTVRMGPMGTLAIEGAQVTTTHSGDGGMLRETYSIPENLHGADRISIRLESPQGFFSYNWFFNRDWSE